MRSQISRRSAVERPLFPALEDRSQSVFFVRQVLEQLRGKVIERIYQVPAGILAIG